MIDEKDIEIAKLRGQVEALEKMIKQLMAQPQPAPQFVPYPVPQVVPTYPSLPATPWVNPWDYGVTCGGVVPSEPTTLRIGGGPHVPSSNLRYKS